MKRSPGRKEARRLMFGRLRANRKYKQHMNEIKMKKEARHA